MDSNNWPQSLHLSTGSKRSGLSPFDEQGREVKKHRTQAYDDHAEQRVIPVGSAVLPPLTDLPWADPSYSHIGHFAESWGGTTVHGTPSNNAINSHLGYGDQHGMLSCQDIGYGGNSGNQMEPAHLDIQSGMDFVWGISSQHPYQDCEFRFDNIPNGEVPMDLGNQFPRITDDKNPAFTHDAPEEIDEDNAGLHAIHSQVYEMPLQGPLAPVLSEESELCYEYDTCLGVLVASPMSSFTPENGLHSVNVKLKKNGDIFILHTKTSETYAGILSDTQIVNTLSDLPIRLDATLLILEDQQRKRPSKSKSRKYPCAEPARKYILRIIIHCLRRDKETVGDLLAESDLFLQHPYADEVLPEVEYENPHYLLRPGAQMARLKNANLEHEGDSSVQSGPEDETSRITLLGLFETAATNNEVVAIPATTMASSRLRSALMSHQVEALAFMLEKERGEFDKPMYPPLWRKECFRDDQVLRYRHSVTGSLELKPFPVMGGVLADDMGLGKTLSVLALICSSLDNGTTMTIAARNQRHRGTLIIAPKSTIHSWQMQASQHIHEGQLKVMTYHGSKRSSLANELLDVDVVITTYETVRMEWADQSGTRPIQCVKWLRVVLDEAHHIRNRSKQAFQSVCDLQARYRWCLTGTPVHNSLDDYGALISFIRVYPFQTRSEFISWIVKPMEENNDWGVQNLQKLVQATCLRRTKEKALQSGRLTLPPRSEKIQNVYLHPDDQVLYDSIKNAAQKMAANLDKKTRKNSSVEDRDSNVLHFINSLRLICNHGQQLMSESMNTMIQKGLIPKSGPGDSVSDRECSSCGGEIDKNSSTTIHLNPLCDNCATSEQDTTNMQLKVKIAQEEIVSGFQSASVGRNRSDNIVHQPSAKVLALLENLKLESSNCVYGCKKGKSVVFSAWVRMLDLIEQALHGSQIGFQRIDGQTSLEGRQNALLDFNERSDCKVMLATIGSVAEGVDLIAANTVHLMEPHWNPMVEAQAVDRVYRIGQTQEVTVIRYIVPDSVETYVQVVQEEKLRIIKRITNLSELKQDDLDLERRQALKRVFAWVPADDTCVE